MSGRTRRTPRDRARAPAWPARPLALALLLVTACGSSQYREGVMHLAGGRYPGRFVDVGAYGLFFRCAGQGSPTMVLESGGGGTSLNWLPVESRLERHDLRVCSYDRAGLGWSQPDPDPAAYDIEREVDALHSALREIAPEGPLVLVGASYGGWLIRLYAAKYPDRLRGLLYVDPNSVYFFDAHPDALAEVVEAGLPWFVDLAPRWLVRRVALGQFSDRLTGISETDRRASIHLATSRRHMRTSGEMTGAFARNLERMRRAPFPEDLPTRVITRGLAESASPWGNDLRERDWREGHLRLIRNPTRQQRVIALQSRHSINYDQPELIVDQLLDLLRSSDPG